ncbi:hypothetical protein [Bradyrhizobium sp.]|uniref:hypothetical protein n=1 Tax=Bradyrhizobium sp. TaxID=376 RepID=UPI002602F6D3|nr:hypothetical protein [Bradyrhizobium sp.]
MQDIPQFVGDLLWNFWTVSIGIVLAIEPVVRWFWPGYDAWATGYLTADHRRQLTRIAAILAFLMANYIAYHGAKVEMRASNDRVTQADKNNEAKWPALTTSEIAAFRARAQGIPPEHIVVACETVNCRDLADGLANALKTVPGWKVEILHRGGLDITGVTGIQINPNEAATVSLKNSIEATTGLTVTMGPDTRKDVGGNQSFLVVGNKPF